MPGSIFQDEIKGPNYTPTPSTASVVDTSTGDFLRDIAPAVGQVKDGYTLRKAEVKVFNPVVTEYTDTQAQISDLRNDQREALADLSSQDKDVINAAKERISAAEKKISTLPSRSAVEVQARLDSEMRTLIAANPHLSQEIQNLGRYRNIDKQAEVEVAVYKAEKLANMEYARSKGISGDVDTPMMQELLLFHRRQDAAFENIKKQITIDTNARAQQKHNIELKQLRDQERATSAIVTVINGIEQKAASLGPNPSADSVIAFQKAVDSALMAAPVLLQKSGVSDLAQMQQALEAVKYVSKIAKESTDPASGLKIQQDSLKALAAAQLNRTSKDPVQGPVVVAAATMAQLLGPEQAGRALDIHQLTPSLFGFFKNEGRPITQDNIPEAAGGNTGASTQKMFNETVIQAIRNPDVGKNPTQLGTMAKPYFQNFQTIAEEKRGLAKFDSPTLLGQFAALSEPNVQRAFSLLPVEKKQEAYNNIEEAALRYAREEVLPQVQETMSTKTPFGMSKSWLGKAFEFSGSVPILGNLAIIPVEPAKYTDVYVDSKGGLLFELNEKKASDVVREYRASFTQPPPIGPEIPKEDVLLLNLNYQVQQLNKNYGPPSKAVNKGLFDFADNLEKQNQSQGSSYKTPAQLGKILWGLESYDDRKK